MPSLLLFSAHILYCSEHGQKRLANGKEQPADGDTADCSLLLEVDEET